MRQLHREFLRAGADVMQTFTFYASDDKLKNRGHTASENIGVRMTVCSPHPLNVVFVRPFRDNAKEGLEKTAYTRLLLPCLVCGFRLRSAREQAAAKTNGVLHDFVARSRALLN